MFKHTTLLSLILASGTLCAQSVDIKGHSFDYHAFASQGFAYTNQNNFLTMKTSEGSIAMTDGGLNVSTRLTDHLRVGAQFYISNVGRLGAWRPQLDWAVADYRFSDTIGIRAGKVKTALGLYTDTQDATFLHTWAILPQSLYPTDLRDVSIAHTGGDVYGTLNAPRKLGSFAYTLYAGVNSDSKHSGYYFNTNDGGIPVRSLDRSSVGADVRWTTPLPGFLVGSSFQRQSIKLDGNIPSSYNLPYRIDSRPAAETTAFYGDYSQGKFHLASEFRHVANNVSFTTPFSRSTTDVSYTGWFGSAAYRLNQKWEVGTYNSRFWAKASSVKIDAGNHIFDQAVTVRYEVTKFWSLKAEAHFMDGFGDLYSAHGFYVGDNPAGLKPTTNMFVLRSSWNR